MLDSKLHTDAARHHRPELQARQNGSNQEGTQQDTEQLEQQPSQQPSGGKSQLSMTSMPVSSSRDSGHSSSSREPVSVPSTGKVSESSLLVSTQSSTSFSPASTTLPSQNPPISPSSTYSPPQSTVTQNWSPSQPSPSSTSTTSSSQQEQPEVTSQADPQTEHIFRGSAYGQSERVQSLASASVTSLSAIIWHSVLTASGSADAVFDPITKSIPGDLNDVGDSKQVSADAAEKVDSSRISPGAAAGAVIGALIAVCLLVWLYRTMMQKKERARMLEFARRASFFVPPANAEIRGASIYGATSEEDWTPDEKVFALPPALPLDLLPRASNPSGHVDGKMMNFRSESDQNSRQVFSRASTPLWMQEAGIGEPPAAAGFSLPRLSIVAPSDSNQGTSHCSQSCDRLNRAPSTDSGNHLHPLNPFLNMRVPSPKLEIITPPQVMQSSRRYVTQYVSPPAEKAQFDDCYIETYVRPESSFSSSNPFRNSAAVRSSASQSTRYRYSVAGRSEMDTNPFDLEPDLAHISYLDKPAQFPAVSAVRDSARLEQVHTQTTICPEHQRHSTSSSLYTFEQARRIMESPAYSGVMSPQPPGYDVSSSTTIPEPVSTDNSARSSLMGKAM